MTFEPDDADNARAKREQELGGALSQLEKAVVRFRERLDIIQKRRMEAADRVNKISRRRKESIEALKMLEEKNELFKRSLVKDRRALNDLSREEKTSIGMYHELLSGRPPSDIVAPQTIDELMSGVSNDEDLVTRKERFLTQMNEAFEKIEERLSMVVLEIEPVKRRIADVETFLTGEDRRRDLLFHKLKIYKDEHAEGERALRSALGEEEALLQEYGEFIRSIKSAVALPSSVRSMLTSLGASEQEKPNGKNIHIGDL